MRSGQQPKGERSQENPRPPKTSQDPRLSPPPPPQFSSLPLPLSRHAFSSPYNLLYRLLHSGSASWSNTHSLLELCVYTCIVAELTVFGIRGFSFSHCAWAKSRPRQDLFLASCPKLLSLQLQRPLSLRQLRHQLPLSSLLSCRSALRRPRQ